MLLFTWGLHLRVLGAALGLFHAQLFAQKPGGLSHMEALGSDLRTGSGAPGMTGATSPSAVCMGTPPGRSFVVPSHRQGTES